MIYSVFILHSKLPSADVDGLGSGEPAAQRSQLLSGSLVERPPVLRVSTFGDTFGVQLKPRLKSVDSKMVSHGKFRHINEDI